jgi:hypothetical protein
VTSRKPDFAGGWIWELPETGLELDSRSINPPEAA